TAAFVEKFNKYQKYVSKGIVKGGDPFVIAINGQSIPYSQIDLRIPRIVSAVLPFGDEYVVFDRKTMKAVDAGFQHRPSIKKLSGSDVPTTAFENKMYEGVSAVLYSTAHVWCYDLALGDLSYLVHNPLAKNPLPRGFIKTDTEYWVDG